MITDSCMQWALSCMNRFIHDMLEFKSWCMHCYHRGLPLITYAPMGGGGSTLSIQMRTRGERGSEHDQKYTFCTQVY